MPSVYELGLDARAGHWRVRAAQIISRVISEHPIPPYSANELKRALFNAYPYGERKYHPYKIWLDEIARQTGKNRRFRVRVPGRRQLMSLDPDPAQEAIDFGPGEDSGSR